MALRLAIDVNRYVDFCRGDEHAVSTLNRASEIFIPFITLAELRAGFRLGTRVRDNEAVLASFLKSPRTSALYADEGTVHCYAVIFAELRQAGTLIPINDLWIAALAMQHELALFTRDKHFDYIPRIPRI